jgi:hypothetical protein
MNTYTYASWWVCFLVMFMAASVPVGGERWSLVWAAVCPGRPHQGMEAAAGQTSAAYARQHKGGALGFSHPSVARLLAGLSGSSLSSHIQPRGSFLNSHAWETKKTSSQNNQRVQNILQEQDAG